MLLNRKKILLAGNNNKRLVVALVFVFCASFTVLAQSATRSIENLDIDAVVLRGSSELKISFGDETSLRVHGDDKELDKQPFFVRGNTLYLGYSEKGKRVKNVKYKLVAQDLNLIELDGSGTIWVMPVITDELRVELQGSGDIRMHSVEAAMLDVSLAGSGNIQLAKATSEELSVGLAGSGDIDLGNINAVRMSVDMSGSGDIVVSDESEGRADELDIGLAGSGDIHLATIEALRKDIPCIVRVG